MDRPMLYDILYALAARDGREAALFGNCAPLAHEAFVRSLAGDYFPEIWFEVPLAGEPWFDLHTLVAYDDLDAGMTFVPETCGFCPEAFLWFAAQKDGVRQLALSWDVSSGDVQHPAVQLLVGNGGVPAMCGFLEAAGRADAASAYAAFAERLPEGWFPCYSGVFPRRSTPFLRVECIPGFELQQAYAQDPALLEVHLCQTGFDCFGQTVLSYCQVLADTPFGLEFQFDVSPDGRATNTLGASVRFAQAPGTPEWQAFEVDGAAGELMDRVEAWGLVDGRWRILADTAFAKRAGRGGEACVLYCYPAFLKLRWRDGEPLDAKAYLIAGAQGF